MANPSATYCESKGYTYQIITNPDGSQSGNCVFPSGKVCDGWAYYRGECNETSEAAPGTGMANPSATFCESKGYTYRIVTNPDGSQAGNCVFPSGKVCDGWAYYRGECSETTAR
jgi:putative hemolysin